MESTTLTLMGIFANFAISYAANNVPTLRELINRKNGLDDRIEECFEKALKRWSVNSGVRGIEKSRMNTHLQDLQKVFFATLSQQIFNMRNLNTRIIPRTYQILDRGIENRFRML